jgi:hypothetical protein
MEVGRARSHPIIVTLAAYVPGASVVPRGVPRTYFAGGSFAATKGGRSPALTPSSVLARRGPDVARTTLWPVSGPFRFGPFIRAQPLLVRAAFRRQRRVDQPAVGCPDLLDELGPQYPALFVPCAEVSVDRYFEMFILVRLLG